MAQPPGSASSHSSVSSASSASSLSSFPNSSPSFSAPSMSSSTSSVSSPLAPPAAMSLAVPSGPVSGGLASPLTPTTVSPLSFAPPVSPLTHMPPGVTPADLAAVHAIQPRELAAELRGPDAGSVLVLDVRPFVQFRARQIAGATNLCVPSTLLKRPAFTIAKILNSLAADAHASLADWQRARKVVVYDNDATTLAPSSAIFQTAKKFVHDEGFAGEICYLKGGLCQFAAQCGDLTTCPAEAPACDAPRPARDASVPIMAGLHMPSLASASPVEPFFADIRQNVDLADGGVGEPIPICLPPNLLASLPQQWIAELPRWMSDLLGSAEAPAKVAGRFLQLELEEKRRLQDTYLSMMHKPCSLAANRLFTFASALERVTKNRYKSIYPFDHTRVKLRTERADAQSDYINASHLRAEGSRTRYIATQGPLPETFSDFWSVVWDQRVRVILMLTPIQEGGQVKCDLYWADRTYGQFVVAKLSEEVLELSPETRTTVCVRQFALTHTAEPFSPMRQVIHIQFEGWPDLGTPSNPLDLVSLIRLTKSYNLGTVDAADIHRLRTVAGHSPCRGVRAGACRDCASVRSNTPHSDEAAQRPIVVHCSAGCGRTGTFCTTDSVIDILEQQDTQALAGGDAAAVRRELVRDVDLVSRVVHELRTQRLYMVQNLRQFVMCYEAVLTWKLLRLRERLAGPDGAPGRVAAPDMHS
ncbi:protein-tyrosine phosphatase-like protein [Dipodascopsis tothii]|uniref:protein-tyrosine phosphatase-like protein n=1 Tax=Dipodascopsis tothii TaxID=44089 RepID=UPI0034CE1BC3